MGKFEAGKRVPADIGLSIQTNRVPVIDGHRVNMSIKFEKPPTPEEAIQVLREYRGSVEIADLPSAPDKPVLVRLEPDRPQPRRDRDTSQGMSVTVGSIRPDPLLDLRMISVVHNTLRGAASGSILNAELLVSRGYL
jgi:aspartate-semialdehyde dehydrogenase